MENRRNYYRILHVQPDAPLALIKSSYRTLMQTLKMHPDLGGDNWNAQLINEAYAELSDQERREEYDARFLNREKAKRQEQVNEPVSELQPKPLPTSMSYCLFCKTPYRFDQMNLYDGLCQECASPLNRLPEEAVSLNFKRSLQRIKISELIKYYTYWPQAPKQALVTNLSPRGVGLLVENFIVNEGGVLLKLEGQQVSGVARIVHQRSMKTPQSNFKVYMGMEFLSCHFEKRQGCFLSLRV